QQLLEFLAIFGGFDGVDAGADDGDAGVFEAACEVERCLATELDDDAVGLDAIADVEDVFDREGLEEEHVACVVIGAHGLGIRIDHDRFDYTWTSLSETRIRVSERRGHVTELFKSETRVAATVVELDTLADTVGAAAEDDDPFRTGFFWWYF